MGDRKHMDFDQKTELADALAECSAIKNDCETVVSNLPKDIRDTIQKANNSRIYVTNIVTKCLEHKNGLEKLVKIVGYFERGSKPMRKVYEVLVSIWEFEQITEYEKLSGLFAILSDIKIKDEDLKKYYKSSLAKGMEQKPDAVTFRTIIKDLCDIPPQSPHPMITFIKTIAAKNAQAAEKLKQWTDNAAPDFEPHTDIDKPEQAENNDSSAPVYVLVEVSPYPNVPKIDRQVLSNITVYSWKHKKIILRDDCLLSEFSEKLDKLIMKEFDENDDLKFIDFILPCELIHLETDQWDMKEGRVWETKFGKKYVVANRVNRFKFHSRKTDVHHDLRRIWKENWERLNKNPQVSIKTVGWVCCHKTYDAQKLCKSFTDSKSKKNCLMMCFMPNELAGLGFVIVHAGIPVALLHRKSATSVENHKTVENKIKKMLKGKKLTDLPDLIHEKRSGEDEFGKHLTLIWDDPKRMPDEKMREKSRLQAP
ncbi:MAG: hypothetical protein GY795_18940 [Desulfobacterales bacterium]|nr:hypothetical protein [Desulfobacterales bacterium]